MTAAKVRKPAAAGRFYPASASTLRNVVRQYIGQASVPTLQRVRAVIAPHAGYACSGAVAGAAFHALQGNFESDAIVYLLGPAHYKPVHGVAASSAEAFATPLGTVPIDVHTVARLVTADHLAHFDDEAHTPEHCLEVELPFLQYALGERFRIVPLLFDDEADIAGPAEFLANEIRQRPDARIVVSSDLSHYHPYAEAVRLDRALVNAILAGDRKRVAVGEACGRIPILCLMQVAQRLAWQAHLLTYANSGDTCGPKHEVVGYAALAFTEL
ncbi:MAG: AmmeMemoRadiSam system protein B [Caldilinea sp.]|nr:AmmeMemoRadiSam system protein B [Caldilinea sp.]MDW8439373.1 AmmeMemoRadiSam system protein B [Caldilineaceae bacterium]